MQDAKQMAAPLGIDWDTQPLGLFGDGALSLTLGVRRDTVRRARESRGIPSFADCSVKGIDWAHIDFTGRSLDSLAAELDICSSSVSRARKRLGILPSAPRRQGKQGNQGDRTRYNAYALKQAQEAAQRAGQPVPQNLEEARVNAKRRSNQRKQSSKSRRLARRRLEMRGTLGNVYFARAGDFIKIGWAENVERRVRLLQTACPLKIELLGFIPEQTETFEHSLHKRFVAHHVRGEWFNISDEILSMVPAG